MLVLSRRNARIKRNSSLAMGFQHDNAKLRKQSINSKRSSVAAVKLFIGDLKPDTKLSDLVKANLDGFFMLAKLFNKYSVHTNPFDMTAPATQDFNSYSSKFEEVMGAAKLTIPKIQQKLIKFVNQQFVNESNGFQYICQQFLIKQQQVLQTIFESEKYLTDNKIEEAALERILEWNNMDIVYSYIFWKNSHFFEVSEKAEHRKLAHKSIMAGFKRFKQLLYFANGLFVAQRSQYQTLLPAFESLQAYAVKAYDVLVKKLEQLPGVTKKDMEIFETLRNMSKDFVSGDFSGNKPIADVGKRVTQFFNRLNNANETFKFLEAELNANILEKDVKLPTNDENSFQMGLSDDSSNQDPLIDLFKNNQDNSQNSDNDSDSSSSSVTPKEKNEINNEETGGEDLLNDFMRTDFYKKHIASKDLDTELTEYMGKSPDNPMRNDVPYLHESDDRKEIENPITKSQIKSSMTALYGDVNSVFDLLKPDKRTNNMNGINISKLIDILEEPPTFKYSSLDLEDKSIRRLERINKNKEDLEQKLEKLNDDDCPRFQSRSVLAPKKVLNPDFNLELHPI